ncbi:MAG: MBL fold metallo-hydrolase [Flavobacteriaceae bacterium]|nr:MBL fold metallo-hydrolase [Flavobacteriaceae bacterium]
MEITFLGTGTSQGIPVIGSNHPVCKSNNSKDKRLRSSILISQDNKNYVIDCGPDFRQQMIRNNIQDLNAILFTHEHSDHVAGLDDIRPFYFRQGEFNIYGNKSTLSALKVRYPYIFNNNNNYPGVPKIKCNLINITPFIIDSLIFNPIKVYHNKLEVLGFRINNFAYLTDVKTIKPKEIKKLSNLKVLVLNCLRIEYHHSHLNLEEAISLVEKINPKICYFTHISHHLGFHNEVEKLLPENIYLAYDQLKIQID